MKKEKILHVENLSKSFPVNRGFRDLLRLSRRRERMSVLEDVSFSLNKGTALAVVGSNGAGKTTLLRLVATLLLPDGGEIFLEDQSALNDPLGVRKKIGFVSGREGSFYPRLTGRENLIFFADLYGAKVSRVEETLELVRLGEAAERLFKDYSAGMRRRLDLARALLADPPLLLLDEPTKSLDPHSRHAIQDFLRTELISRREKSVLIVSHDRDEVERLVDRVLHLEKGRVVSIASPKETAEAWR